MRFELEGALQRWAENHLLDAQQAERIRAFEAGQKRTRWPVLITLSFGGIMLAAGVLLFVSAHWDELSPFTRMTILVLTLGGFHVGAALTRERFPALGTTLHAVGTVSLGGAIALAGQIFNMQEHWPTAILLWALGAAAAWLLLGEWPQLAVSAILIPWWLIGEWTEAAHGTSAAQVAAAGVLLLAICYLSVRSLPVIWIGGLAVLPAAFAVAVIGRSSFRPETDLSLLAIGWACAILLPLALAWADRRARAWMNAVAAAWVIGLTWIAGQRLDPLMYAWLAAGSGAMIAWGIHELRSERINLGMAGFAITIIFFFFSSVMDKLGRSASLIALGLLFVGGSWYWERLRRRLVAQVQPGGAQ